MRIIAPPTPSTLAVASPRKHIPMCATLEYATIIFKSRCAIVTRPMNMTLNNARTASVSDHSRAPSASIGYATCISTYNPNFLSTPACSIANAVGAEA